MKRRRAPELAAWQERALDVVSHASLANELVFGGGAALAAVHLHHRTSADLDFFLTRQIEREEAVPIARALTTASMSIEVEVAGPRTSLLLRRRRSAIGRIDFAFYPYEPIGRRTRWRGLTVEALGDMTVNKVQAVLTRFQPRDFVDLFFLLQEGPERDLVRLLNFARAKFEVGPSTMGLAARLLLVHDIRELPEMIRPVDVPTLVEFFEGRVRDLMGKKK